MVYRLLVVFCILILFVGSFVAREQSSYAQFMRQSETLSVHTGAALPADGSSPAAISDANAATPQDSDSRTLDDIALDKRIAEERAKNERTWRESGIVGTSFVSEVSEPRFDINALTHILDTIHSYMNDHPEQFAPPTDSDMIRRASDPRVTKLLYGTTKGGIIAGFDSDDLVAWDLKQKNGDYTYLLLARDVATDEWRVVLEGDVYKLREELSDGD